MKKIIFCFIFPFIILLFLVSLFFNWKSYDYHIHSREINNFSDNNVTIEVVQVDNLFNYNFILRLSIVDHSRFSGTFTSEVMLGSKGFDEVTDFRVLRTSEGNYQVESCWKNIKGKITYNLGGRNFSLIYD